MEIQIDCVTGKTSRYKVKHDGYGADLINSIRPSELFRQPFLRIQSGKSGSLFVMNQVETIRFITPIKPELQAQPPAKEFRTISEKDYQERLAILYQRYATLDGLFKSGTEIETALAVHCVSGRVCHMVADVVVGHRLEQNMDMRGRLERLTALIPCPQGCLAINPHNIRRIDIYPAPPVPAHGGWLVD